MLHKSKYCAVRKGPKICEITFSSHPPPPPSCLGQQVPLEHRPATDILCMELYGLGSALDCASSNAARMVALRRQRCAAPELFGLERSANLFPRLRQALERGWKRAAIEERRKNAQQEKAAGDTSFHRTVGSEQPREIAQQEKVARIGVVPPTPSEVLTVSSIRMMLGMASAFRTSNPAVLQVLCGTLLDLLLETPPLVLAPLHRIPSSIEATTFRRVSEFCVELVGSADHAEREPALGLYLALAISRGEVSGLLQVVRCLLDCDRKAQVDVRQMGGDSEDGEPPLRSSPGGASPWSTAGAAEPGQGRVNEPWNARISAVLGRLANHNVDLHLSFPNECEGMKLRIRVPRVAREGSTGSRSPSGMRTPDQDIEWDCPTSAATDGRFVFAWHPDFGLLKAGTGLGGTTRGQVYARNSEAGSGDVSEEGKTVREGFVAVIGDVVFLQTGCFTPPHRFLLARTSNLEVQGIADAMGLKSPIPASMPSAPAEGVGCHGGDDERIWGGETWAENMPPTPDAAGEDSKPYTPLCCDGRLVYAIVPVEVTGRPSVIAMDVATTGRVTGPAVELQCPVLSVGSTFARDATKPHLSTAHPGGESERCVESHCGISGTDEKTLCDNSPREWPWWRTGKGAKRGVRTYCNGSSLVVCWVQDVGVTGATGNPAAPWRYESARGEIGPGGLNPSPSSASGAADDTDFTKTTRMVRFDLSTGECEPTVEKNDVLSGVSNSSTPWVAYDSASNLILRCELRRLLPSTSSSPQREHTEDPSEVGMCICLWQNCGLTPGPRADGRFGWRGALGTSVEDPESVPCSRLAGHFFPGLRETAVFVLAHLDRLGAHYVGWKGGLTHAEGRDPILPPHERGSLSVPFCYDLSTSTFRHLVGLLETFAGSIGTAVQDEDEEKEAEVRGSEDSVGLYVLCASLRLLNVNVGILLAHGLGVAEFGGESLRQSLLRCLLDLVRHYDTDWTTARPPSMVNRRPRDDGQVGKALVAREALRLLVDRVDLFYPSQARQAGLLSSYLRVYVTTSESHTTASRAVMLELLGRTSSLKFLRSLLASRGGHSYFPGMSAQEEYLLEPSLASRKDSSRDLETAKSFSEALLGLSSAQSARDVQLAAGEDTAVDSAAMPGGGNELLSDPSSDSAKQVGSAVLGALGAVLKLRCIDAFEAAREEDSEGLDSAAELRTFLLLVLQAANSVLAAAVETQRSTTTAGVLEKMAEALRNGLVGTLLPRCLASALILLDKGGRDGPGPGVADFLSQVTNKLRLLTMRGPHLRGLEKRSPSAPSTENGVEIIRADCEVEARGQEGRGSEISAGGNAENESKASTGYYVFDGS